MQPLKIPLENAWLTAWRDRLKFWLSCRPPLIQSKNPPNHVRKDDGSTGFGFCWLFCQEYWSG